MTGDIYRNAAARIFGADVRAVTDEQRTKTKKAALLWAYGAEPALIMETLHPATLRHFCLNPLLDTVRRFMSYVDKLPCGCWFWTGGRSRGGGNRKWYGSFWVDPRHGSVRAHRFAAVVLGSGHTGGNHLDHSCCFSLCVFPLHLDDVTPQRNQELKVSRRAGARLAASPEAPSAPGADPLA